MCVKNKIKPNTITFSKSVYQSEEEFWRSVSQWLKLITEQGYYALFRYEDCGVYVIEFDYDQKTQAVIDKRLVSD